VREEEGKLGGKMQELRSCTHKRREFRMTMRLFGRSDKSKRVLEFGQKGEIVGAPPHSKEAARRRRKAAATSPQKPKIAGKSACATAPDAARCSVIGFEV